MKSDVRGSMSSSIRSLVIASAVASMALMGSPAEAAYEQPYKCPESLYTAIKEKYQSGSDDTYEIYQGAKAPSNWDHESCGSLFTNTVGTEWAFPGTIHYPSGVTPIIVPNDLASSDWQYDNGWGGHRSTYELLKYNANYIFNFGQHPWFTWSSSFTPGIDWNGDGVIDWDFYGANEIAAVKACRYEWFNSGNLTRFKLRESYKRVKVYRPRNCKKDKAPQWSIGTGTASPLGAWDWRGVSQDTQQRLSINILNNPGASNTKYIAMFVNGLESCKGYPQSATGSDDGWKIKINNRDNGDTCNNKPKRDPHLGYKWFTGEMHTSKHALANIFVSAPGSPNTYGQDLSVFPIEETLIISVPDAAFSYPGMPEFYGFAGAAGVGKMVKRCNVYNSFDENKAYVDAWVEYLGFKVEWGRIKGFYGMGASRGGCLVTKIADQLFSGPLDGKGAKLILETLDPVCAPAELDNYRYKTGFARLGKTAGEVGLTLLVSILNPLGLLGGLTLGQLFWTQGDKSVLAGSPMANLGDNMEIRYPIDDNKNWKEQNQCNMMKLDKMFGSTPRKDIRWLNSVSGENVLGGNVDWTAIYAFCSDKTMGPATNIHTGQTVSNLYNDSIDAQLGQDIKGRGHPDDWIERFSRNEDGNPIGTGLKFQNLWLDFNNNAFVSGPTDPWTVNPISWQSVSNPHDNNNPFPLPNSNNPMPGFGQHSPACDSWYKQVWVPFNHQTTTAGIYVHGNPSADSVGVPCFGQSSCGYGIHEPQNPDGSFPLPLQQRSMKAKNCIPFPRADIDFTYKHAKHAHQAYIELFYGVDGDARKQCDNQMIYSGDEWTGPDAPGGNTSGGDKFSDTEDSTAVDSVVSGLGGPDRGGNLYDTTVLTGDVFDGEYVDPWATTPFTSDSDGETGGLSGSTAPRPGDDTTDDDSEEIWFTDDKDTEDAFVSTFVFDEEEVARLKAQAEEYAEIYKKVSDLLNPTDEQVLADRNDEPSRK